MPQNYQFAENLIRMREHYQALNEEYERATAHATEQLNHINALLVDQLVKNQQFIESLVQLREHYQTLLKEQQQQAHSAKEQIAHFNALLADQIVLKYSQQQPISISAATLVESKEQEALPEATDSSSEISAPPQIEEQTSTESSQVKQQKAPAESLTAQNSPQKRSHYSLLLKTPLLPQYSHLNKVAAVEKVLQENEGSILHINDIVRALYGEVEPQNLKAEKIRMSDTLTRGVAKGLWDRVLDPPGYYTIDLKLIESNLNLKKAKDSKPEKGKTKSKLGDQLLPRYRDLNLTQAVETVIREKASDILTIEQVTRAVYGELEGQALTKAKGKVGKTLWAGANQKRWRRVPGQLGAYTLVR